MRVIGGSLRGKRLFSPRGRAIRPTSDRLRETIFNIIRRQVPGASVLDLFAGTGAMGIEALSRGALFAWFVDLEREAIALVEKNLSACRLMEKSVRIRWDITMDLACLHSVPAPFTLVFIDPPYGAGVLSRVLGHLVESRALAGDARIILEHGASDALGQMPEACLLDEQRRYGKTVVSLIRYMV